MREDTLFYRYGFHPDGTSYQPPGQPVTDLKIALALAERTTDIVAFPEAAKHFVIFMSSEGAPVPASLSDLRDGNMDCLRRHRSHNFTFRILRESLFEISSADGVLLVPYASYVVETFRLSHCASIRNLALHFVRKGSRFYLGYSNGNPFADTPGPPAGLGFRLPNFTPSPVDFKAYIKRRNDLLREPSIVRAALMMGGIIWRLAVDSIQDNYDSVDFAHILSNDSEVTQLTHFDLGVISGLYIIWTGKCLHNYLELI